MQAPTHILAGIAIAKLFEWRTYRGVALFLIATLSLLSHAVLDKLAKATYHKPDAEFNDPVWLAFHIAVALITLIFLYLWWTEYKWGIVFALLPDFDWVIVYSQKLLHLDIPFYNTPHLHNAMNWMMDHTIPFCYLNLLPDNNEGALAAFWEVLVGVTLILLIRFINSRRKNIHFH